MGRRLHPQHLLQVGFAGPALRPEPVEPCPRWHQVCCLLNPLPATPFHTANKRSFMQEPNAPNTHSDHVAEPADVLHGAAEVQAGEGLPQRAVAVPLENRRPSALAPGAGLSLRHVAVNSGKGRLPVMWLGPYLARGT